MSRSNRYVTAAYRGMTGAAFIPAIVEFHPSHLESPAGFPAFYPCTRKWIPALAGLTLILFAGGVQAYDLRGHAKAQLTSTDLPEDSLLQDFSDDPMSDSGIDLRLSYSERKTGWNWRADYQLLAVRGDRLELARQTGLTGFTGRASPEDDLRLFDLTHRISEDDDRVVTHRLDRFYLGHTSAKTVVNFGRQAISWGNGLIYNPVDFFNPFDPAAIDTEYKTGDDMLYGQYLYDSGDDLQLAWVFRRDDNDDIDADESSLALKYHGFAGSGEYDMLLAEHYDDAMVAAGGAFDFAEAVWRGDILFTDTADGDFISAVLNWSYSWLAWNRNLSANLEYYHNGFGIDDGDYGAAALADNPELTQRVQRGELFTLGQNYFAAAASIELAPLWTMTTTLFRNLDDDSILLQVFSRHDLQQDLQLLIALNLTTGDRGSEFGGIDSAVPGRPLSVDESLFLQLARYF